MATRNRCRGLHPFLAVLAVAAAVRSTLAVEAPAVNTKLGRILGSFCPETRVARWVGIPYAIAPVGELRWAAPVPWTTPAPDEGFSATTPGSWCPQLGFDLKATTQSEDCLFLNVWAPAAANASSKLPVRLWIHGGSYLQGGGIDVEYDGCQVAQDADVVSVTINYRLGMLGFLAHPYFARSSGASGNLGLLDQRMAMQWVQDHIAAFGGDPARVLLTGESAGGFSVFCHTLMPQSRGLFFAASSTSGNADVLAVQYAPEAYYKGGLVQAVLNCTEEAAQERGFPGAKECMLGADTSALLAVQGYLDTLGAQFYPHTDGVEFPKSPLQLMKEGAVATTPFKMGVMAKEGLIFLLDDIFARGLLDFQRWSDLLKGWFHVPAEFESRMYEQYNADKYGGSWTAAAQAAITDGAFHCATRRAASYYSKKAPVHVFLVQETKPNSGCSVRQEEQAYPSTAGIEFTPELVEALGAFHGYDVPFHFMNPYATSRVNGNCSFSPNEAQLASFMSGIWSSMAATGSPLPPLSRSLSAPQLRNLTWPLWTSASRQLLNLDFQDPQVVDLTADKDTCKVWDDLMDYFDSAGTFYPTPSLLPPPPAKAKQPPPAKAKRPPPRKLGRQPPPQKQG